MKKILFILCLAMAAFVTQAQSSKTLELKDVLSGKYYPKSIRNIIPMPDGEHYAQMNAEGTQITKYSFKTGEPVETIFDLDTAREMDIKHFDSFQFSPDGKTLLIATNTKPIYRHSFTADYYLYPLRPNLDGVTTHNKGQKLSDGGPQQSPVFSPDGFMVAFVRDNNIFLVKTLYENSESQVTEDGEFNKILNGIADWVYEEEFAMTNALQFNADNTMLAYLRFDESEVPSFSLPLFAGQKPTFEELQDYPGDYTYKYPKSGYPNSKVEVRTFDIKSRVTRTMQVPLDSDGYIPRIKFTNDPNKLAVVTLNRHQNLLNMYFTDPRSTVSKSAIRDESPYYISENVLDNIKFYPEGFSYISDKSGYPHLYWYNMNGNLVKQVTSGNYEVKSFAGYDSKDGSFYFTSNEGSPMRQAIYKVDKKGKKIKLSQQEGTNRAMFSPTMKYYINNYTNLTTPTIITLNDNNGKVMKTLVDNKELAAQLAQDNLPKKEFFSFKTAQGVELNGWMMLPTGFSPDKKYPVIMFQYSGPGSQEVLDRYGVTWETYMASQGYIIACVDGRGTGGRGVEFQKGTYLNLGVQEAQDQVATAQYLGSLPYVNKDKIGIWGWSYGGFTTIMSMSEGTPVFKAGVAVAAPTDWKFYDTIYTERYMRTPKENSEGYAATSAFNRAHKLHGDLLLIHGLADDNVHFQNMAEYSEQLVQLDIPHDMHLYTNRNHSIFGGNTRMHLYKKIGKFFDERLK